MSRVVFLIFVAALGAGTFLIPTRAVADAATNDPQSWEGTWTGTISTLDSHSGAPTTTPITIVITKADIGKTWTIRGDSLTKDENLPGMKSSTILTRTGPNTCSLTSDGTASGRSGFTRHVTGDLTRH